VPFGILTVGKVLWPATEVLLPAGLVNVHRKSVSAHIEKMLRTPNMCRVAHAGILHFFYFLVYVNGHRARIDARGRHQDD